MIGAIVANKPTAEQKRRFDRVAALGCLVCGGEANIHHCRFACGMGQRNHDHVAPLCKWHHQDGPSSRHGNPRSFAMLNGGDRELHERTCELLGDEPCEK